MIAIIFEVETAEGCKSAYLDIAADLRPLLEQIDGFISVERFQSLSNEGKLLSLSLFRDEKAVRDWRQAAEHRVAQDNGRTHLFSNYRIRVAEVLRDYGKSNREQAPQV